MQENNFEKQVQQKIDELKLIPSDEVWQKVAVVIAKQKSDRRILVFGLILLLFIGSAIFIIADFGAGKQFNKVISEKNGPAKINTASEQIGDASKLPTGSIENISKTDKKNTGSAHTKIKDIAIIKNTGNQQKPAPAPVLVKTVNVVAQEGSGHNNNDIAGDREPLDNIHKRAKKLSLKTGQQPIALIGSGTIADSPDEKSGTGNTPGIKVGDTAALVNDRAITGRVADTAGDSRADSKALPVNQPVVMTKGDKKDATVKQAIKSKQKGKWKIGFNLSLGVTTNKNGYLGIIGSGNSDEYKVIADVTQSPGGNNGGQASAPIVPSKIKAGPGIVLGIFFQKELSAKTSLLVGLNYKSYNSAMMIGSRVDSISYANLNNFFYRNGNTQRYKNNFHFIELPLTARFKLGNQNKVPVYLNTGVSFSRLISSNALQFSSGTGSYYRDNNIFNKNTFNISAGLLFSISGHAKNPFLIGPDINFSLNKMAGSGLYGNRHYSYFGILLQKSISKK